MRPIGFQIPIYLSIGVIIYGSSGVFCKSLSLPAPIFSPPFSLPILNHQRKVLCGLPHRPDFQMSAFVHRLTDFQQPGDAGLVFADHASQRCQRQSLPRHLLAVSFRELFAVVSEGGLHAHAQLHDQLESDTVGKIRGGSHAIFRQTHYYCHQQQLGDGR